MQHAVEAAKIKKAAPRDGLLALYPFFRGACQREAPPVNVQLRSLQPFSKLNISLFDANNRSMEHAGEILVLTGPPGSGKTTTARALAGEHGSSKVHLHSDDFWHFIRNGAIPPYLPRAHDQNVVVVDVLANAASGYAKGGYFVIVDGIVGPWFLAPFRKLAAPLHYIVLRPSLAEAIRRCRERGGETLTDPGPISELHRQFSTMGQLERHVLPTDGHTRQETLRAVVEAVEGGTFRLA